MHAQADLPRLLHFRVSHYNEKVRWALDFKDWPHRRTALTPGLHLLPVRLRTGQNQLPILKLDGRWLHDSSAILLALERLRPEPPLFPEDPAACARALALEAYFDDEVAPALRRLFWGCYLEDGAACARMATMGSGALKRAIWRALFPLTRPLFRRNMGVDPIQLDQARARLPEFLARLESEIGPSGYLVGDRFSVADLTAAAVMTALLRPPEFPYPLPEPWPPALVELRESIAEHAASRWIMELYRRHRGVSREVS
jgi:glutathione S-transferase